MNMKLSMRFGAAVLIAALCGSYSHAQTPTGVGEAALAHAASANKTLCLVFYRDWDTGSAALAQTVKAHSEKFSAHAAWNLVKVSDPAEKGIVERFKLSRAPMPMAVVIHPTGAVTGFFAGKTTEAELARTLVSPKKAECMKALQDNQLVLLCLQTSPKQPLPVGVLQFQGDPHFGKNTRIITALASDGSESAFFAELKVSMDQPGTVFMAPPGVMVGHFPATVSRAQLATALHAAGKCCDDKNCKHKH